MKVYVMTEAKPFGVERYVDVKKSLKEAENAFREVAPCMRKADNTRKNVKTYFSDASGNMLFFIHEKEI